MEHEVTRSTSSQVGNALFGEQLAAKRGQQEGSVSARFSHLLQSVGTRDLTANAERQALPGAAGKSSADASLQPGARASLNSRAEMHRGLAGEASQRYAQARGQQDPSLSARHAGGGQRRPGAQGPGEQRRAAEAGAQSRPSEAREPRNTRATEPGRWHRFNYHDGANGSPRPEAKTDAARPFADKSPGGPSVQQEHSGAAPTQGAPRRHTEAAAGQPQAAERHDGGVAARGSQASPQSTRPQASGAAAAGEPQQFAASRAADARAGAEQPAATDEADRAAGAAALNAGELAFAQSWFAAAELAGAPAGADLAAAADAALGAGALAAERSQSEVAAGGLNNAAAIDNALAAADRFAPATSRAGMAYLSDDLGAGGSQPQTGSPGLAGTEADAGPGQNDAAEAAMAYALAMPDNANELATPHSAAGIQGTSASPHEASLNSGQQSNAQAESVSGPRAATTSESIGREHANAGTSASSDQEAAGANAALASHDPFGAGVSLSQIGLANDDSEPTWAADLGADPSAPSPLRVGDAADPFSGSVQVGSKEGAGSGQMSSMAARARGQVEGSAAAARAGRAQATGAVPGIAAAAEQAQNGAASGEAAAASEALAADGGASLAPADESESNNTLGEDPDGTLAWRTAMAWLDVNTNMAPSAFESATDVAARAFVENKRDLAHGEAGAVSLRPGASAGREQLSAAGDEEEDGKSAGDEAAPITAGAPFAVPAREAAQGAHAAANSLASDPLAEPSRSGHEAMAQHGASAPSALGDTNRALNVAAPSAAASERTVPTTQVSEELASAVGLGRRNIRLRVAPPGLGELAVDVRVSSAGRVSLRIAGDAEGLAASIRSQAESLQQQFQERGLTLETFEFRGGANSGGGGAQSQGQASYQEQSEDRSTYAFERLVEAGQYLPSRDIAQQVAAERAADHIINVLA